MADSVTTKNGWNPKAKRLSLALQGGGAHGAFTWGVLDTLLADGRIAIEAISGASAGAMNAVALVDGFERGGPEKARAQLDRFWTGVYQDGGLVSTVDDTFDAVFRFWSLPGLDIYHLAQQMTDATSPYLLNPLDVNPLRVLLEELLDFKRIQASQAIKLFISATNVRTGRAKIFVNREITPNAVLASAALPNLFQAVEIDGEAYWDGGYVGNPPLSPFYEASRDSDILLVQVDPLRRDDVPTEPGEILERVSEVTFGATLTTELRSLLLLNHLAEQNLLDTARYKPDRLHRIDSMKALSGYHASSKFDIDIAFLKELKAAGQRETKAWLKDHFADLGERSTLNLGKDFVLGPLEDRS